MTITQTEPTADSLFRPAPLFRSDTMAAGKLDLDRLAALLNRTFDFSLSVRAIAEVLCRANEGEILRKLTPLDIEGLLTAIRMLTLDMNRDLCRAADAFGAESHM